MSCEYWIVWTCWCVKYTPAELDKHTMYKSLIIFAVYLWIFQNTNSCTSHALYSSWQKLFVNWTLHAICCSSPTQKQFFTLFSPNIFFWRKLTKNISVGKRKEWLFSACAQIINAPQKFPFTEVESLKSLSFRGQTAEIWPARPIEVMPAVYNEPFLLLADNKALTSIVFALLIIEKRRAGQTSARSSRSNLSSHSNVRAAKSNAPNIWNRRPKIVIAVY